MFLLGLSAAGSLLLLLFIMRHSSEREERQREIVRALDDQLDLGKKILAYKRNPETPIDEWKKLLPKCRELDALYGKLVPSDANPPSLERRVSDVIDCLEKDAVAREYDLLCKKIAELIDDPFMTDAKWREWLPICREMDAAVKKVFPEEYAKCCYSLEKFVEKIINPDLTGGEVG